MRDLGGLDTWRGTTTQSRRVFRSASSSREDEPDIGVCRIALNVGSAKDTVNGLLEPRVIIHSPVFDDSDHAFWNSWQPRLARHTAYVELLGEFYLAALWQWPVLFGNALRRIAQLPKEPILIHCRLGRDRTGLVVALLLSVASVRRECIVSDYAKSQEALKAWFTERMEASHSSIELASLKFEFRRNQSPPEAMAYVLQHLDLDEYLDAAGISSDDRAILTARLVDNHE